MFEPTPRPPSHQSTTQSSINHYAREKPMFGSQHITHKFHRGALRRHFNNATRERFQGRHRQGCSWSKPLSRMTVMTKTNHDSCLVMIGGFRAPWSWRAPKAMSHWGTYTPDASHFPTEADPENAPNVNLPPAASRYVVARRALSSWAPPALCLANEAPKQKAPPLSPAQLVRIPISNSTFLRSESFGPRV